jgi:hypothetical protein
MYDTFSFVSTQPFLHHPLVLEPFCCNSFLSLFPRSFPAVSFVTFLLQNTTFPCLIADVVSSISVLDLHHTTQSFVLSSCSLHVFFSFSVSVSQRYMVGPSDLPHSSVPPLVALSKKGGSVIAVPLSNLFASFSVCSFLETVHVGILYSASSAACCLATSSPTNVVKSSCRAPCCLRKFHAPLRIVQLRPMLMLVASPSSTTSSLPKLDGASDQESDSGSHDSGEDEIAYYDLAVNDPPRVQVSRASDVAAIPGGVPVPSDAAGADAPLFRLFSFRSPLQAYTDCPSVYTESPDFSLFRASCSDHPHPECKALDSLVTLALMLTVLLPFTCLPMLALCPWADASVTVMAKCIMQQVSTRRRNSASTDLIPRNQDTLIMTRACINATSLGGKDTHPSSACMHLLTSSRLVLLCYTKGIVLVLLRPSTRAPVIASSFTGWL